MDIVSRLKTFIDHLGVPVTQFADNCGIPRPTLSQLLNGRNKTVRDELIAKIHAAYPRLSVMWLMFGEGEAILDASTDTPAQTPMTTPLHTASAQLTSPSSLGTSAPIAPGHLAPSMRFHSDEGAGLFDEPDEVMERDGVAGEPMSGAQSPIDFSFDLPPQHDNGANLTAQEVAAEQAQRQRREPAENPRPANGERGIATSERREATEERTDGSPEGSVGQRRVVSIIVYYSDSSFQAFVPDDDNPASLPFAAR